RSDLPQVEGPALRRRAGACDGRGSLPPLRHLPRAHHRGPAPGPAPLPLAAAALRVREEAAAEGSPLRRGRDPARHRAWWLARAARGHLAPGARALRARPPAVPALLVTPLVFLFVLSFVMAVDNRIIAPLLPSISDSLATTPGAAGLAMTTYAFAYGAGQLLYGPV